MQISELQTFIRYLTSTDSTSLTAANLLIFINQEYERIVGKLISETAGAIWQYGDAGIESGHAAFPNYTIDLVNAQQEYDLSSLITTTNAQTIARTRPLTIMGVEVDDQDGNAHVLRPITLRKLHEQGIGQADYQSTDGLPFEYEKREHSLLLYPAPATANVTLTNGLRIFFLRTANIYTSAEQSTGTREPAFPSPWHDALAYGVAYIVAIANGLPNANQLLRERETKEKELLAFISRRNQDDRPIMTNKPISHI